MFWDKWIPKKYLVKSEICAIELAFTDTGTDYHFTHLRNKNNKLEIAEKGTCADSSELPKLILKNKIPLLIIANGKGIILKKIALNQESEQNFEQIIKNNLPTINTNEFFVQLYKQTSTTAFIALCRKEQLLQIVNNLKTKKYDVASIYLGAPAIIGLQPLWTNYNSLPTTFHTIEITNDAVETINTASSENSTVKIDDISFDSNHSLGFAAGLSYLTQTKITETENEELVSIENIHLQKNKFKFLMICVVAIAFVLAITNVMFYTTYFDKNNKLETELGVYQGKYEQINTLLNDYQKKKDLIENAGVLNKNKLSEYADKIAGTIPDEVSLSEFYFNPKLETDESEDSLVTFENKHLILKGNCNKSLIINEWVNVLKMQKFIKDVALEKFSYNNEGILPNFEIRIITE